MTEFLTVTTTLVMGYSIYQVFQSVRQQPRSKPAPTVLASSKPAPVAQPVTKKEAPVSSAPTPGPSTPAPTVAASRRRAAAPVASNAGNPPVRDPVSGEVIAMPTNYRFAKKWLKEALVSEGLLDRVYKPNELDEAANQRTREALERFKTLPKYQA